MSILDYDLMVDRFPSPWPSETMDVGGDNFEGGAGEVS